MSATTSQPAAEMSIPAEPGPSEVGGGSRPPGPRAAPARKRFRNRPGRTTGAQARSAAPEKEYDMYDNDACGSGHRGRRRAGLRRAGLLAAALACLALVAAACSSPAKTGTGAGPAHGSARQSELAFSRCMRAHGISDFPDPNAQGGIALSPKPGGDLEPNNPRFQAANQACQHYQPGKGGSFSTNTSGGSGGGS